MGSCLIWNMKGHELSSAAGTPKHMAFPIGRDFIGVPCELQA